MHQFFYSDTFNIPLPEKHRFPGQKYKILRERLVSENILKPEHLIESPLANYEELLSAHSPDYIKSFETGRLNASEMRRIGFPWSEFLVKRTKATVGGALASARSALKNGISGQLAGGTHHAHYDFGSGYCIFNDFAVVAKHFTSTGVVQKVAVIDLDVHQGDGNSSILKSDSNIFVFSMHGAKNFPFRKYESDLDIELQDNCSDEEYLDKLNLGLIKIKEFKPDLILYQAGVDVLKYDKLGRLNISFEGLFKRDLTVFNFAKAVSCPVSMAIGGGYSEPIEKSIDGYIITYKAAKEIYGF